MVVLPEFDLHFNRPGETIRNQGLDAAVCYHCTEIIHSCLLLALWAVYYLLYLLRALLNCLAWLRLEFIDTRSERGVLHPPAVLGGRDLV